MPRGKANNLVGRQFGRLTVVSRAEGTVRGNALWNCHCECGNDAIVIGYCLTDGHSASCGCYRKEVLAKIHTTHGQSYSRAFKVWSSIKQRTQNPDCASYKDYGGRGITLCQRWNESFENFYADMGDPPPGLMIERKDNDGPYAPENCKWGTYLEQMNNKRSNRLITFNGETLTMAQWARRLGFSLAVVYGRLKKWSIEEALTRPLDQKQSARMKGKRKVNAQ